MQSIGNGASHRCGRYMQILSLVFNFPSSYENHGGTYSALVNIFREGLMAADLSGPWSALPVWSMRWH